MEIAFLEIIISGSDKIARIQGGMASPPPISVSIYFPHLFIFKLLCFQLCIKVL